jgi:hypothetical protein
MKLHGLSSELTVWPGIADVDTYVGYAGLVASARLAVFVPLP